MQNQIAVFKAVTKFGVNYCFAILIKKSSQTKPKFCSYSGKMLYIYNKQL